MAIPLEYNPLTKVVPSDPDRLPYVPVQVLYLIAQALPQPSQIFNLARVNKATWEYLQPALYECEVTYEARLVAQFGNGFPKTRPPPKTGLINLAINDDGDADVAENDERTERSGHCAHGLVTALCEVCGQRIAIEKKHFRTPLASVRITASCRNYAGKQFFESRGMTALHWACVQGKMALPVARKAIEAAKAHNPSYIDGRGLRARRFDDQTCNTLFGEIPPPLFTAIAFGNLTLCVVLVQAGCNVDLAQTMDINVDRCPSTRAPFFRIHDSCVTSGNHLQTCRWEATSPASMTCKTAGHVAVDFRRADVLGYLLDNGLKPLMGKEPLIHEAARMCDLSAVQALLERCPDMVSHRWYGLTPLHYLCKVSKIKEKDTISVEDLKSVAAYLLRKGASLEDEDGIANGTWLTPLQYALKVFTNIGSDKIHAPVAFIMLGANWDRSFSVYGMPAHILTHCVREATFQGPSDYTGIQQEWAAIMQKRWREIRLAHAKVLKAIVSNKWRPIPIPDPVPTQDSERRMQVVLGEFMWLVNDRYTKDIQRNDTFAIEAVGRLLLSTGIRPGRGEMESWETLIARNAKKLRANQWAVSPWRELVADLPSAAPAPMHSTAETVFTA